MRPKRRYVVPVVPCSLCGGCGKMALPYELSATLRVILGAGKGRITARELTVALAIQGSPTTANQRLEKLRAYGLIERVSKVGKAWVYTVKGGP